MQFEGIDTDRNYDSCPCRRERESGSSYTKNIQRSRASSSRAASKASTAEAVQYMSPFLPHCNSITPFFFFFLNLIYLFSNWISFKLDYRSLMKSRHHKSGWLCCLDCPTDLEQHRINNIYQPSLGDVKNELCNRWRQTQLLEEESSTQQLQSVNQWTGPSVGKASAGSTWCLSQFLSGSGG